MCFYSPVRGYKQAGTAAGDVSPQEGQQKKLNIYTATGGDIYIMLSLIFVVKFILIFHNLSLK